MANNVTTEKDLRRKIESQNKRIYSLLSSMKSEREEQSKRLSSKLLLLKSEADLPSTAWAENGAFDADEPAVASDGTTGHTGPFPTKQAAGQWGDDHDPEG